LRTSTGNQVKICAIWMMDLMESVIGEILVFAAASKVGHAKQAYSRLDLTETEAY